MKPENFTTLSKIELEAMANALPHMSVKEKLNRFMGVIDVVDVTEDKDEA